MVLIPWITGATASTAETWREVEPPAAPGSGQPHLFAGPGGAIFLSWIEPAGEDRVALRFSTLGDEGWSAPTTVAAGSDWFVNWADVPSLIALNDGVLAAHWLVESGADTYAYEIHLALSHDGGATWPVEIVPHRDSTPTEHGFVTLLPWERDELLAVWLDGRGYAGPVDAQGNAVLDAAGAPVAAREEMSLRYARIAGDGRILEEAQIDGRTCDCCPTSAVVTPQGAAVVYRDRSEEEIRDIFFAGYEHGAWSEPRPVHADGWKIPGCPVNGPAIDAQDGRLAVAWFTAAGDSARVHVAFATVGGGSTVEGLRFDEAIRVDDGDPIGRTDVVLLDDGSALVSWLERDGEETDLRVRRLWPDGRRGPSRRVALSIGSAAPREVRATGMPRMVRRDDEVVFAWTRAGETPRVETGLLRTD
jgi:hypothetical protein